MNYPGAGAPVRHRREGACTSAGAGRARTWSRRCTSSRAGHWRGCSPRGSRPAGSSWPATRRTGTCRPAPRPQQRRARRDEPVLEARPRAPRSGRSRPPRDVLAERFPSFARNTQRSVENALNLRSSMRSASPGADPGAVPRPRAGTVAGRTGRRRPAGDRGLRDRAGQSMEFKGGVEYGFRAQSAAVVGDGTLSSRTSTTSGSTSRARGPARRCRTPGWSARASARRCARSPGGIVPPDRGRAGPGVVHRRGEGGRRARARPGRRQGRPPRGRLAGPAAGLRPSARSGPASAILVRPDRVIAWRSISGSPAERPRSRRRWIRFWPGAPGRTAGRPGGGFSGSGPRPRTATPDHRLGTRVDHPARELRPRG